MLSPAVCVMLRTPPVVIRPMRPMRPSGVGEAVGVLEAEAANPDVAAHSFAIEGPPIEAVPGVLWCQEWPTSTGTFERAETQA